jgi:large subunit ribosomal protein L1
MAETAKKVPAKKTAVKKSDKEEAPKKAEIVKEVVTETEDKATTQEVAKAGKRSAKAVKEAEEVKKKEERKTSTDKEAKAPVKPAVKPTRSRLERRGKKYRELSKLIEENKVYSLADGIDLAVKTNPAKFDAAVELHINLNVDPRHADQNVRDMVVLPAGTGKTVRVAVLVEAEKTEAAKKAGAEIVGNEEIFQLLDKESLNFDVLVATPSLMPKLGKYAKLLGPKGLMPNPKSGTVTPDVAKAVQQAKAGRVEYRVDSTGIIHIAIGKVSFGPAKLLENGQALLDSLRSNKPSSVKGTFIGAAHVTTTMGPSITIDLNTAAQ